MPQGSQSRIKIDRLSLLAFVFLGLTLIYALSTHLASEVVPEDDAFITYRYAENLRAGNGPVYNPGQKVFGISSPAYLAWLAGIGTVFPHVPIPDLAVRANAIFFVVAVIALYLLLRRLVGSTPIAASLAGLFALRPDMLQASLGGMEPFLFSAIMALSLWAVFSGRHNLAALLAGISILVRPEGVFLAVAVCIAWLRAVRPHPATFFCCLLLPPLIWIIFGFAYYGTPIYHSLIAKARPLYVLPVGHAADLTMKEIGYWTLAGFFNKETGLMPLLPGVLFFLALVAVRFARSVRNHPVLPPPGAKHPFFPWDVLLLVFLLLFYILTNPLMFVWYFPPIAILWMCTTVASLLGLIRRTDPTRPWRKWLLVLLLLGIFLIPPLRLFVSQLQASRSWLEIPLDKKAYRLRVHAYRAAAEWLNPRVPAGTVLAAPEIGALGYYYQPGIDRTISKRYAPGPVLDACGLVSPEAIPFLPVPEEERSGPGAIPRGLIKQERPDVVVTMARYAYLSLYRSQWFQSTYTLVHQVSMEESLWGSKTVEIFFRSDLVAEE